MASSPATGDDPGSPAQVRHLLTDHDAADDREGRSMRRVLAELERLPRPCDEQADPVHVTASAVVVGPRGTILLLHRRLRRWLQPGGHVEPGESPPEAARRESEEETGLSLTHPDDGPVLVHVDVHEAALGHTHLDLRYLLIGPDADPAPPPDESPHVRWYDWEDAESIADRSLVGALRAARALAPGLAGSPDLGPGDGAAIRSSERERAAGEH